MRRRVESEANPQNINQKFNEKKKSHAGETKKETQKNRQNKHISNISQKSFTKKKTACPKN